LAAEPTDPPLSTMTGDWVDPGAKNSFSYSTYNAPARTIDRPGPRYSAIDAAAPAGIRASLGQ